MTAMREALKKAGVDTTAAELYAKAVEFLRKPESADQKIHALLETRHDLRTVLYTDYIARVRADMKGQAYQAPQQPTSSPQVQSKKAMEKGAEKDNGAEIRVAPKRAAKQAKPPKLTKTQIAAKERRQALIRQARTEAWETRAAAVFGIEIEGRLLGDITLAELGRMRSNGAADAAKWLYEGKERGKHAILLNKIAEHAQAADPTMKVRDAVSAKQLEIYVAEADIEILEFIQARAGEYKYQLEHGGRRNEGGAINAS